MQSPLPTTPAALTPRERDVARLVLRMLSYKGIGNELGISDRTAERHVTNIGVKIDGRSPLPTYKRVLAWAQRHAGDLSPA